MKKISKSLLFGPLAGILLILTPLKADINVVTSIKPLHSLTSYIMEGVGEPDLIIQKRLHFVEYFLKLEVKNSPNPHLPK